MKLIQAQKFKAIMTESGKWLGYSLTQCKWFITDSISSLWKENDFPNLSAEFIQDWLKQAGTKSWFGVGEPCHLVDVVIIDSCLFEQYEHLEAYCRNVVKTLDTHPATLASIIGEIDRVKSGTGNDHKVTDIKLGGE